MAMVVLFPILVTFLSIAGPVISTRPIYNIAHMVNAVKQIDEWLDYGANAMEADVGFAKNGKPNYFYHGLPCDAFRNCLRWAYIGNYVKALRERTNPLSPKFNRNLVLFMFDVKITKLDKSILLEAGKKFAETILIPLYKGNPTKMKVQISVVDFTLKDFIKGVLNCLQAKQPKTVEKIGFEINSETDLEKPSEQEDAFKKLGVAPGHAWLSEGITNWGFWWHKKRIINELNSLVQYRDNHGNYFSKVYAWTINSKSTAAQLLETGIDGIITNQPANVNKAIEELDKKREDEGAGERLRLATLNDDPFQKYFKK